MPDSVMPNYVMPDSCFDETSLCLIPLYPIPLYLIPLLHVMPNSVVPGSPKPVQYADPFHECVLRKQPVPVDSLGQRSVDVDVTLCYCNEDLCNEVLNGAPRDSDSTTVIVRAVSL